MGESRARGAVRSRSDIERPAELLPRKKDGDHLRRAGCRKEKVALAVEEKDFMVALAQTSGAGEGADAELIVKE